MDDQPKTGVYTEVEDEDAEKGPKRPYFQDPYVLPAIPELKLADPTRLLEKAMERTKRVRSHFRVQYIPLEEMFTSQELMDLRGAFDSVSMAKTSSIERPCKIHSQIWESSHPKKCWMSS